MIEARLKEYAEKLINAFEASHSLEWRWFEDKMTYSNGLLPEALLLAYKRIGDPRYLKVAQLSLDFLLVYSFEDLVCVPIGQNGWFSKGKQKYIHDQQPEEVTALVEVLKLMYEITREEKYKVYMKEAFNWFLGNNLLGQVVYDQTTGGCFDGIGEKEVNLNQGAESTISYLLARLAVEDTRE